MTQQDNSDRKQIRFGHDLLDLINKAKGNASLSSYVKKACKAQAIKDLDDQLSSHREVLNREPVTTSEPHRIEPPKLEAVHGLISHKVYRVEIDGYVMTLVASGLSRQAISDQLNELGWISSTGKEWTRHAVHAITRRQPKP